MRDRLVALGKGLIGAQADQFTKAKADLAAGHYSELAGHGSGPSRCAAEESADFKLTHSWHNHGPRS